MLSLSELSRIKNNPNTRGVKAIPREKILQKSIVEQSLHSHDALTDDDISYMINLVLNLDISNKKLTNIILHIYKLTNTGRFSLTFNTKLDIAIKNRDRDKIINLITISSNEAAWPELYDNQELDNEEIENILSLTNKEYFAILNSIQTASSSDFENILPCVTKQDEIISYDKEGIYYNSLYSKCYKNICLYESEQIGKIISTSGIIPSVAYLTDFNKSGQNKKYCFKMMELIERFARNDYTNSKTGTRFSDRTISQVISKFGKEIKMYRRYLSNIQ